MGQVTLFFVKTKVYCKMLSDAKLIRDQVRL